MIYCNEAAKVWADITVPAGYKDNIFGACCLGVVDEAGSPVKSALRVFTKAVWMDKKRFVGAKVIL